MTKNFIGAPQSGAVLSWRGPSLGPSDCENVEVFLSVLEDALPENLSKTLADFGVSRVRVRKAFWRRASQLALMLEGVDPTQASVLHSLLHSQLSEFARVFDTAAAGKLARLRHKLRRIELHEDAAGGAMQLGWDWIRHAHQPVTPVSAALAGIFSSFNPAGLSTFGPQR